MAVKTEKELSESQRALWLKAVSAIELRNFGYAVSLLQEILKQEPEFLTGRQLLRRSKVTKSKSVRKSFFNISTAPIGVIKAQREIKNDPKRVVEMLEEVLEGEPYNRQANLLLKEAAVAAGWPEIGVFALRTCSKRTRAMKRCCMSWGVCITSLGTTKTRWKSITKSPRSIRSTRRRCAWAKMLRRAPR